MSELPLHSEICPLQRAFSVACVCAAAGLVVLQVPRLLTALGVFRWWMLIIVAVGMLSADLVSGIVHWAADTWGSESMPIIGKRFLEPFRIHHVNPDDFLRRDFFDVNGDVAMISAALLAAVYWIPLDRGWGQAWAVFMVSFVIVALPTNQVRMAAHNRPNVSLQTTQSRAIGHGWISGVLSATLGAVGLGAVLCFLFPTWLTTPELRALYPIPYVRAVLHLVLVAAFLLGALSVSLRRNKALSLVGIGFTLIAALLGGSQVPIRGELSDGPFLGLDWFLLNLMMYSAVYVPLERLFAHRPQQPTFRKGWRTDLTYFFVNSLLVQLMTLLTLRPAIVLFDWARIRAVTAWVSSLPFPAQLLGVLLIADLTQYWVHRAFHEVPFLWRFHAVHHSAEEMDWLAGSRIHLVDAVVTRASTYVPIYVPAVGGR